ncbi:MAG TPA: type IX secretion system membrane protein PorP/SprF [Cytophagaceae bacterium]
MKYIPIINSIAVALLLMFGVSTVSAQQQGQYSQYMMNYFLVNPAAAGTTDYIDLRAGYRMQWLGLSGAPRNYYVSGHVPINKVHKSQKRTQRPRAYHVIGGLFTGQTIGVFSHNTGYISYAYHLPLSKKWNASMGANVGFNQIALGGNMKWIDQIPDPTIAYTNQIKPDISIGGWLYSDKFFMGVSTMQMLQNKLDFSRGDTEGGVLNRHFYITGGYNIQLNNDIRIIPSAMIKTTASALQLDINTKVRYQELFWGGISYRRMDAFVAMGGIGIPLTSVSKTPGFSGKKQMNYHRLEIGYSYDITTSKLSNYSGGSHEIMVGLLLPLKAKVVCPKFW